MTELTKREACVLLQKVQLETKLAKAMIAGKELQTVEGWDTLFHLIAERCNDLLFEFRPVNIQDSIAGCVIWIYKDGEKCGVFRTVLYQLLTLTPNAASYVFDEIVAEAERLVRRAESYETAIKLREYLDSIQSTDKFIVELSRDGSCWGIYPKNTSYYIATNSGIARAYPIGSSLEEAKKYVNDNIQKIQNGEQM